MRKVRCGECGRRYDFDVDDFCPKCGAFNQPPRSSRIGADGQVVRVDGLNESGHAGSFVHEELHREDRVRRRAGLERTRSRTAPGRSVRESGQGERKKRKLPLAVWIILAIFGINLLVNVIGALWNLFFYW